MKEPKPSVQTSEFWTFMGALITAITTIAASQDRWVQIAALGAMAVLGAAYFVSRGLAKKGES